jgi:hypothetical protein
VLLIIRCVAALLQISEDPAARASALDYVGQRDLPGTEFFARVVALDGGKQMTRNEQSAERWLVTPEASPVHPEIDRTIARHRENARSWFACACHRASSASSASPSLAGSRVT